VQVTPPLVLGPLRQIADHGKSIEHLAGGASIITVPPAGDGKLMLLVERDCRITVANLEVEMMSPRSRAISNEMSK
jgi:hypothetical protein